MNATHSPASTHGPAPVERPDIREYGAEKNGERQASDKRLFMQLLVFTDCLDPASLVRPIEASGLEAVLYLNANDARGVGILCITEDPNDFTDRFRKLLISAPFSTLKPCPEFTMMGRTYSSGFEQDLEDWILKKPRRNAYNPALSWAIWYPLRRKGEFESVPKEDQRKILFEHAKLGMGYGAAEYAHDIRLACHGVDKNDNEFVLGIVSSELYPLSRLVQDMRKTQQTSKYIQSMGPFFVGKVFHRFPRQ